MEVLIEVSRKPLQVYSPRVQSRDQVSPPAQILLVVLPVEGGVRTEARGERAGRTGVTAHAGGLGS